MCVCTSLTEWLENPRVYQSATHVSVIKCRLVIASKHSREFWNKILVVWFAELHQHINWPEHRQRVSDQPISFFFFSGTQNILSVCLLLGSLYTIWLLPFQLFVCVFQPIPCGCAATLETRAIIALVFNSRLNLHVVDFYFHPPRGGND